MANAINRNGTICFSGYILYEVSNILNTRSPSIQPADRLSGKEISGVGCCMIIFWCVVI